MMSLWDALRMNMMISYQELVRTFPNSPPVVVTSALPGEYPLSVNIDEVRDKVVVDLRPVMSQPVTLQ
ncbi:hypothetical protein EJ501_19925 [Klebsiella pneumoniae subsp. pneumoniae]|nr:hypothetical protein EJ501_19925 [Klebsiella pneumoniae subsp. pneumoniae]